MVTCTWRKQCNKSNMVPVRRMPICDLTGGQSLILMPEKFSWISFSYMCVSTKQRTTWRKASSCSSGMLTLLLS